MQQRRDLMAKKFKVLADDIQAELLRRGFVVHRYDAYSSQSVYLKLDYGACGSVRVSDHPGYKHLHYMWNIGTWIDSEQHENHKVKARHFYPVGSVEKMVGDICGLREYRKAHLDYSRRVEMGKYRKEHDRKGFWAHPSTHQCHLS